MKKVTLVALLLLMLHTSVIGQSIVGWDGGTSGNGTAWLTDNNWTNNAAPGANDIAVFGSTGSAGTIGINLNLSGNRVQIGAIRLLSMSISRIIENSSSSAAGVLQLNGASGILLENQTASGRLTLRNGGSRAMSIWLNATGQIHVANAAAEILISSDIAETNGSKGFTKTGNGLLTLAGSNSFTGGLTINSGVLSVANVHALNSVLPNSIAINGGTLRLSGSSVTVGGLSGNAGSVENASGTPVTLTVNRSSGTDAFGGTLTNGVGAGALSLTKSGVGTLELNATNAFTGKVTVTAGTLAANTDLALGSITELEVSGGTLIFGGTGNRINDLAGVILSGGTLATAGLDESLGALTLSASSTVNLGSGASTLTFASGTRTAGTLTIENWSGSLSGSGTDQLRFTSSLDSTFLANINFAGFGAGATQLDFGTYFEVVPVPEPATVAGALGLLGVAGWCERRRWASLGRQLLRRAQRVPAYVIRNAVLAFFGFLIFGTIFFFA